MNKIKIKKIHSYILFFSFLLDFLVLSLLAEKKIEKIKKWNYKNVMFYDQNMLM